MSGRGDNNKNGTSGQGASNASKQANLSDGQPQPKSNHGKKTGGKASKQQNKSTDSSSERNQSKKGAGKNDDQ
jgi:hypothetical protein